MALLVAVRIGDKAVPTALSRRTEPIPVVVQLGGRFVSGLPSSTSSAASVQQGFSPCAATSKPQRLKPFDLQRLGGIAEAMP